MKKFKRLVNSCFLMLFLLGYLGVIIPSSVIVTLLDIEVYALEENTTYTLSFNTMGGYIMDDLQNQEKGTEVDLTAYVPQRDNYDFEGWYSDVELNNKITSITLNDNEVVYANWVLAVGEISLTYNSPVGLGAFSINNSTIEGNTVNGYTNSNHKNRFTISPMFLEGYAVDSVVVTDENKNVYNFGPGEVNDDLVFEVNGSTSYTIEMSIIKPVVESGYTITYMLNGLISSNNVTHVTGNEDYRATLSLNPDLEEIEGTLGYSLPSAIMVLIGDVEYEEVNYNPETGEFVIPALLINDNITIIAPAVCTISRPVAGMSEFTYDGEEKMLVLTGIDDRFMEYEGVIKTTNAGEYSVVFLLNDATYGWSGGEEGLTEEGLVFNWVINKASINPSVTIDNWKEGSEPSEPVLTGNTANAQVSYQYKIRGSADSTYNTIKPTKVGEYTLRAVVSETENYLGAVVTCEFEITGDENTENVSVDLPMIVNKNYVYTGEEINVDVIYQEEYVNVINDTATLVGTYKTTYSLKSDNYTWGDGTKEDIVFEWNIIPGVPAVNSSYTYNTTKLVITSVLGANGYQIFECNSKGESCKQVQKSSSLIFTQKNRSFNKSYYYKIRAYTNTNEKTVYGNYTNLIKVTTGLNAPVVKATTNRYQEVKVTWNKESGAEKYYVDRCNEDGSGCKNLGNVKTNSFVDKTGKEGTTYKYKVRAYRSKKYSKYSDLVVGIRLNDDLVISVKNNGYLKNIITINKKDGATKYEVYKSSDNKKWKLLKSVTIEEDSIVINDNSLSFNKKYYYRVRAYNGVNYTSYNTKNVTTTYLDAPIPFASGFRYKEVKLTWDKTNGAEKYYVYTCDVDGNNCKLVGNTKTNSYTDKKAKEGVSTYYKVKSYKAGKYSKYSILTQGFRQPDNLNITVKNTDYLTNNIVIYRLYGAYKYELYRSTDNKKWTAIKTFEYENDDATPESMVYDDTNVSYNKKYYYRVRAYNGVNYTSYTTKNVTTKKLKAPVVSTSGTIYHPVLNFTKVEKATGYEVYHSTDEVNWTKEQSSSSLTFTKEYSDEVNHYYKIRAYRKEKNKTYYSDYTYITYLDFK